MRVRSRVKGLDAFGAAAGVYDRIRPGYAPALIERLRTECGIAPGARMIEIGPGTGQMTRGLLTLDPVEIMAYEPDRDLAAVLTRNFSEHANLRVHVTPFEAARLAPRHYDLAVAATSFHWLGARSALAAVKRALKPGGWWLACWHIFNDPWQMEDAFRAATAVLFAEVGRVQQDDHKGLYAFGLDQEVRIAELKGAGFADITHEVLRETIALDTEGVLALYATFSPVATLVPEARAHFDVGLRAVMEQQFGGTIIRPLLTPFYLARRPA